MAEKSTTQICRHAGFRSEFLATERDILVYVPEGYGQEPDRRYPVLYLQDGQNLFDPETSYVKGMDWRVQKSADAAIRAGLVEPLIIVGICHAGLLRIEEYTPTEDKRLGGGLGPLYGRMLVEEVVPFIRSNYRILDGSEHTGIGGSSLGGLIALYLGFTYPDVFGRIAALSPSIWWNDRAILGIARLLNPRPRPRIWLDIGMRENRVAVKYAVRLFDLLVAKGWKEDEDLRFRRIEGGTHDESAWAERVTPFVEFLFPATAPR